MSARPLIPACAVLALLLTPTSGPVRAQGASDTTRTVTFGAFVDGYYAWDFNCPPLHDRAFTTQPARDNEFNVNLAYAEAVLSGPRVRARLAVQFGTSVQANYAGEPTIGSVSGSDVSRYIQEAMAGVKLTRSLWLDAGIYLSHIGGESWTSRDNLTYTRSLLAEFSPYYESGMKLSWQVSPQLSAQFHVLNGWQNISETNRDKAVGARVDWIPTDRLQLSAYNFIGNEAPEGSASQRRVFQGVGMKATPSERVTLQAALDIGFQDIGATTAHWYGTALVARVQTSANQALAARVERFDDPRQVLIATESGAFRANGASLGYDVVPAPRTLWRSELRALVGRNAVFPTQTGVSKDNVLLVSSLALTFE